MKFKFDSNLQRRMSLILACVFAVQTPILAVSSTPQMPMGSAKQSAYTETSPIKAAVDSPARYPFMGGDPVCRSSCVRPRCDLSGTFSELVDIKTELVSDFNGTFSMLVDIKDELVADFNGTFSELVDIKDELVADFNGTFSMLEAIEGALVGCGTPISITQADVGTTGYVIDTPGVYCLAEDIVFNPADPSTFVPVTFTPECSSVLPTGFAAVSGGVVRGVFMTNHGSGFSCAPDGVIFGGSQGSGATGTVVLDYTEFNVAGVTMTNGGSGYRDTVQAAITIKSSNVTLNFNGHTLSQFVPENPSAQVPFVVGVLVPDPLPNATEPTMPNVVITDPLSTNSVGQSSNYIVGGDGVISNFSMYGICVFAHVADIEIRNLTIKNCAELASRAFGRPTTDGLFYLPHDTTTVSEVAPGQFYALFGPSFGVAGLNIGEGTGYGRGPQFFTDVPTNQLNVVNRTQNVRLSNVQSLHNFMFGGFETCITNLTIDNSHFNDTWSDDPGSSNYPQYGTVITFGTMFADLQAGGGIPVNGNTDPDNENVVISNSTFNNTALLGDYTAVLVQPFFDFPAGGIADTRSRNVTYLNCQFNNTSNTFVGGSTILGWGAGGMEATKLENCSMDGHFSLAGINAFHISGTTEDEPYKPAKSITLVNCTANDHQSRPDLVLPAPSLNQGGITGFQFGDQSGLLVQDCQSTNLYYGGPAESGVFIINSGMTGGFADAVIENCLVSSVQTNNGGSIMGFYINGAVAATNFENCNSLFNETSLASVSPLGNGGTTYNVGDPISFGGVNWVSLVNGNVGNDPFLSPSDWSRINTAPPAWNPTTSYPLGTAAGLVSFTDSTGHTNEYISVISGNQGIYPNAPGQQNPPNTVAWVQTNVYPTWNNSANYSANMIVGWQGVSYISKVSPNMNHQPDISPLDWSNNTGVGQGFAIGFGSSNGGSTTVYTNCRAIHNTGSPDFSSGFISIFSNFGTVYDSCIAEQNYRGFFLNPPGYGGGSSGCVVRNCQAYNNNFEGFTDGIPTESFWESNHAYNNGLASAYTGSNQNYNVFVDAAGTIPLPTYNVQVRMPATVLPTYVYANPTVVSSPVHNVSAIP